MRMRLARVSRGSLASSTRAFSTRLAVHVRLNYYYTSDGIDSCHTVDVTI